MKKIFTILLMLSIVNLVHAQLYNNEWIDFNKTYYKFKILNTGLYRIPQSVIASAGLGSTPAQYFQLFRNGQQVPIYTSATNGPLGSNDYIEFWGEMNDGSPDKALYYNPSYQISSKYSLETDTAVYFLTVNPTAPTFQYTSVTTDLTNNTLPVEPYFMYSMGTHFRQQINPGFADNVGEYLYSSCYDIGEGWTSGFIYPPSGGGQNLVDVQNNMYVYNNGPANATLYFGAVGTAPNPRPSFQAIVNNTIVKDTAINNFFDLKTSASFPVSLLSNNSATVSFQNNCTNPTDRAVVSYYEINYPRQFDFNNQTNFYFELPAKAAGYYLQITDFNAQSTAPILYDITNGVRYSVIVSNNTYSVILPGSSSSRRLVLVSENPSNITNVNSLTSKTFVNYANTSNQGNYIIISNPILYNVAGTTDNPVADYQQYRSSTAGGGYKAITVNINELYDQFAFGINIHPLSIFNFLRYARNNFGSKPQFVLLIGHGVTYDQYIGNSTDPNMVFESLVPTFGNPASDNKLSAADVTSPVPLIPIGRISVISGAELVPYLQKVKEYEQAQQTSPNTVAGRGWMKNVVHVTGASDQTGLTLCAYMQGFQQIIQDTLFGANVSLFCDASATTATVIANQELSQLFSTGISILNYFGHSSASTLNYNLNNPNTYSNQGKYPVFYVNGCNAGNYFVFDPGRVIADNMTLSELYVLAKERGSIAFVAATSWGLVNYLNILINGLYNLISTQDYLKPIGITQADAIQNLMNVTASYFDARCQGEQMGLHGDPALKLNTQPLPDYDIEATQVTIAPSFLSVADTSFSINARIWNLGKSTNDSVLVTITRQYPNGTTTTLYQQKVPPIMYMDSIQLSVPIVASRDQGQNYIIITVNGNNTIPEITYLNNSTKIGVYVYVNEAKPIYPYNYSIVNSPSQQLFASTADPLAPSTQYIMQIDTTALFNSPQMVSKTITSVGGLLQFNPGIVYKDSTVYYWRISILPQKSSNGAPTIYQWLQFSFLYLSNSSPGANQSHFYQHTQSQGIGMYIDTASRNWKFNPVSNNVYIPNLIYPTASGQLSSFYVSLNGSPTMGPGCSTDEIMFNVIDPVTFKPWTNNYSGSTGLYNSLLDNCGDWTGYGFDFSYGNSTGRKAAMDFMNAIPNGYYVIARLSVSPYTNTYVNTWMNDTTLYGSGNSLDQYLLQSGCLLIDSFTSPRTVACIYKKGDLSFLPQSVITQGVYDQTYISATCISSGLSGSVLSPLFGPAKQWQQLHWAGSSLENPTNDTVGIQIIGTDTLNNKTTLFNLNSTNTTFDISSINAKQYPYLQLQMNTTDTVKGTPYQLNYWRLNYVPVPEGAIAPNLVFNCPDTLQVGQSLQFSVAFKNVSPYAFDSLALYMTILDHNNVTHVIPLPKKKPLVSGDTLIVSYNVPTANYPGQNTLYISVNPNYAQPEQFIFNNFLNKSFYVETNTTNPTLDVTFDGVHILNQDIVSAKPHIVIKLTDASKYLLLTDTSLVQVQVRFPDGSLHNYSYSSDTLRFTPASNGNNNVATVDFYPSFLNQINANGDQYTLYVTGKNENGNTAGTAGYQISFTVINKAMISNVLNYPNPFSTSTAFVFTITGSQVPQNIKIQILTITGKVVKEITEDELGPLHVGTNITTYKWNGTNQYGQKLANGVYLYHVVTNLNGQSLQKYQAQGDNTDQYFNKGYGKMYLMR